MSFQKTLTLPGAICTSLGCMIGSGWLFASFVSMQYAGPAAIISWLIGGLLIIFIALTFAEISTMFPAAGGIARYAQITYGSTTSFIVSWLAWISSASAAPSEVQATVIYLSHYIKDLVLINSPTPTLTLKGILISYVLLLIFTIINLFGLKLVTKFNNLLVFWKVFIPILISLTLATNQLHFENLYSVHGFAPYGLKGILMAVSTIIVFSYLGFREVTSLGSEIQNPQKTLPYAVVGSVVFAMFFYVFLQICFIISLPNNLIVSGWQIDGLNFSSPVLDLAITLGFGWVAQIVYLDALITPSSTALIFITTSSRLNYAISKNVQAPRILSFLNQYGVPSVAIIFNFLVGALLLSFFPSWQLLVKFQTTAILFAYTIGPLSLMAMRHLFPDQVRPFKLSGHLIICSLAFYSCTLLIFWTGWDVVSLMSLVSLIGYGLFILFRIFTTQNKPDLHFNQALWIPIYIVGLSVLSYFGSYGGKEYISIGYDLLYLFVFSLIIILVSNKCKLSQAEALIQTKLCHTPVDA